MPVMTSGRAGEQGLAIQTRVRPESDSGSLQLLTVTGTQEIFSAR